MVHCGCWTLLPASAQDCAIIFWENFFKMMLATEVAVGGVAGLVEVMLLMLMLDYGVLLRLGIWLMSRLRFGLVTPVLLPWMVSLILPGICPGPWSPLKLFNLIV